MSTNGAATRSCICDQAAPFENVTVVGGGAWGTALSITAYLAGRKTTLWVREAEAVRDIAHNRINPFLPSVPVPDDIAVTDALDVALAGADLAVLVVPSQHLRAMARRVDRLLAPGVPVLICSKGIEGATGKLMTHVVAEEMRGRAQAMLSGPSFAAEVAAGQPTAVTIATACEDGDDDALSRPDNLAARCAMTLTTATFRPYLSDDPIGVEVGGAVKNVLAIACGIAAGRGMGTNPWAALVTRGLAELKRLALALGGRAETVTGLAGVGDLALTCASDQSRNFSFGKALGQGMSPADALAGKHAVVEGVANARSVTALARRLGVEMPICGAVDAIIHGGLGIDEAIRGLLTRPLRAEVRALEHVVRVPHPVAEEGEAAVERLPA